MSRPPAAGITLESLTPRSLEPSCQRGERQVSGGCGCKLPVNRVVVAQGDVCWAGLGEPKGSAPGYQRPVVVVQSDAFNRSTIRTVVCVPLTSNRKWSTNPGNVALSERDTGLPRASVANVTQLVTLDREVLSEAVGHLRPAKLHLVLAGIDVVIARE